MIERIREALIKAGLPEFPPNANARLADFGMDSLIQVLAVIEFEKIFKIKIPAKDFSPEAFHSLNTLVTFLKSQGAK